MRTKLINILMRLSLWRIAIFFIIFLVLLNTLTENTVFENERAYNLTDNIIYWPVVDRNNPLLLSSIPPPKNNEFRIAWVGDSSVQVLNKFEINDGTHSTKDWLPALVLKNDSVQKIDYLEIVFYHLWGTNLLDKYFAVLHALAQKPNMLIININPVSDANHRDFLTLQQMPQSILPYVTNTTDISYFLMFADPGQWLGGVFNSLNLLQSRYLLTKTINKFIKTLNFINYRDVIGDTEVADPYSTKFFHKLPGNINIPLEFGMYPPTVWAHSKALYYNDLSSNSFSNLILRDLLNTIEKSRVKTLVYSLPFNISLAELIPGICEIYRQYEKELDMIASEYADGSIYFEIYAPTHNLTELEFYDLLHLTKPDEFVKYLADIITKIYHESRPIGINQHDITIKK